MPEPAPTHPAHARGLPLAGWLVLVLTALLAWWWSAHKLLEQDEIFSLQTDRVATLRQVVEVQRQYPISLEPPPYHVLSHLAMQVFGPGAFALRLPAYMGYLVMLGCLYFLVRGLVAEGRLGEHAGLVAMANPPLTTTLYYAAEGRPYGLLLGCYGVALVCWQRAARLETRRVGWLVGLACALGLALNVHFYGVLLLVPLFGAELVRTVARRRLDPGMCAALVAGMSCIAFTLPYVKSSGEFKKHYYAAAISAHMLTQPYRQMLVDYTHWPHKVQTVLALLLIVGAGAVIRGCRRAWRLGLLTVPAGDAALLGLLLLLPVFAFAMGRLVTHALEVRHSIGAVLALCSLIALALTPALRSRRFFLGALGILLVGSVAFNLYRAAAQAREDAAALAKMQLAPAQAAAVGDRNLYFQDLGQWEVASLYTPDPALRRRLVLVYSNDEEMHRERHDTMYLTAIHTQRFDPTLPIVSYEGVRAEPGEHIFVTYHSGWSWTDDAFREEAASVKPLGQAFGGDLVAVRFR